MPPYFFHGQTPESRRRVLPGYPKNFVFNSYDEYKQYFVGDRIICLLCGKEYRALGNHLRISHETDIEDYKKKYGILWTKSLLCNDSHEIQSSNTKERIANGEFIPADIEGRRKQAVFARSHKKKKRNLLTHRLSSQKNIEQYNILQKRVSEMTKVKEEPKRKEHPPHIKSFIEGYGKKGVVAWNKGKKTSEETKKKQSISAQMRHSFIKEFK
jgi:hypothetical protein